MLVVVCAAVMRGAQLVTGQQVREEEEEVVESHNPTDF